MTSVLDFYNQPLKKPTNLFKGLLASVQLFSFNAVILCSFTGSIGVFS